MEGLWIVGGVVLALGFGIWLLKTAKARRCRAAAIEAKK